VRGQVQGKKDQEPKKKEKVHWSAKKKEIYCNEPHLTTNEKMQPIQSQMKKHNPSTVQKGQLVHWWLPVLLATSTMETRESSQFIKTSLTSMTSVYCMI
jgi:hypothetical protein